MLLRDKSILYVLCIVLFSCQKEQNSISPYQEDLSEAFGMAVPHLVHGRLIDAVARYNMGIRWIRRDITWENIEKIRGVFDFSEIDTVVNRDIGSGTNVLGILDYSNLLYIKNPNATTSYPPDTLEYFGNYVTQTVTHFKGRINVWEIWNEPNGPTFWKPQPNPREFGKLVLEAAQKIRAADPSAKIMLGGMVGNSDPVFFSLRPWGFLEDLLRIYPDIVKYIDIYAIHPYTLLQSPSPEDGTFLIKIGYIDMLKNFKTVLNKYGAETKQIWATELGWHTAVQAPIFKGVSETLQGAYMVRACVLALSLEIQKVFPYTYCDGEGDLTQSEAHFGMFYYKPHPAENEPYLPKPAYYAYKTMFEQLNATHFTEDLRQGMNLSSQIYAYQFENVIVAWTTASSGKSIQLKNIPVRVIQMDGTESVPASAEISLSQNPCYIRI